MAPGENRSLDVAVKPPHPIKRFGWQHIGLITRNNQNGAPQALQRPRHSGN